MSEDNWKILALDSDVLIQYCKDDNIDIIKKLINYSAEINSCNKDGLSPLHVAVSNGHFNTVKLLLDNGCFLDSLDNNSQSPLHYAAKIANNKIIELLLTTTKKRLKENNDSQTLNPKSYIELPDNDGNTCLHILVQQKNCSDCIDTLLSYNINLEIENEKGKYPIHFSAEYGIEEAVDILIDEGVDTCVEDEDGNTPLHYAAMFGSCECVDLLSISGSELKAKNIDGLTPLHCACLNGHDNVVMLLLTGSDDWECFDEVNITDEIGRTPLHAAALSRSIKCCQLLLKFNGNIKILDDDGLSVISWSLNSPSPQGDHNVRQCLSQLWAWWESDTTNTDIKQNHTDNHGRSPLHYACLNGLELCVKFLISKKLDLNLPDNYGRTPVHYSSCSKLCIQTLIKHGGNVNIKDIKGTHPIHLAGFFSCAGAIEELLKIDSKFINYLDNENNTILHYLANNMKLKLSITQYCVEFLMTQKRELLDLKNKNGQTAIHIASKCGNVIFLESVLDNISKLEVNYYFNTKDGHGKTPLHISCIYNKEDVFFFLVKSGIDPNIVDSNNISGLHMAVIRGNANFIEKIMDCDKLQLNIGDKYGRTPFYYACINGYSSVIDILLLGDVDLEDYVDIDGNTALHLCVEGDKSKAIQILMDEDPDDTFIDKQNNFGLSPLHVAAGRNSASCLKTLLKYKCNVNLVDKYGRSPLHYACYYGNSECVSCLIDNNASVNIHDKLSNSPLFYASFNGHFPCIFHLIKHNAKVLDINSGGRTPLHAAAWFGSIRCCETLIEANNNILDKGGNNGRTALHRAASRGHCKLIKYLINQSADVDACDSDGATPLMLACYYQQTEVIKILLDEGASPDLCDELDRTPKHYTKKGLKKSNNQSSTEIIDLLTSC